jgi:hypothetical protein
MDAPYFWGMLRFLALGSVLLACGGESGAPVTGVGDAGEAGTSAGTGGSVAGAAGSTGGGAGALGGGAGTGAGGSSGSSAGGPAGGTGSAAGTSNGGSAGLQAGAAGGGAGGAGGASGGGAGELVGGGAGAGAGGAGMGGEAGSDPSSGGMPAEGGAGGTDEPIDPLEPVPAANCEGYVDYFVPQGTCVWVHGRFTTQDAECAIVGTTERSCSTVTALAADRSIRVSGTVGVSSPTGVAVDRFDLEGDSCPQLCTAD